MLTSFSCRAPHHVVYFFSVGPGALHVLFWQQRVSLFGALALLFVNSLPRRIGKAPTHTRLRQQPSSQKTMSMRIAAAILSVAALFGTLAFVWKEDSRLIRRGAFDPNDTDTNLVIDKSEHVVSPDKSLRRGSEANRQLQQTFMLKMYWEEGYHWQEEWKERKWCLKCESSNWGGHICKEDDHLLLDECIWNDNQQWFVYERIDSAERTIKLKPWTNPDLCWTRTGESAKLKPCGNDYVDSEGRDTQVFIGFKESGEFELHPNGRSDDCMVNDHREYTVYRSPRSTASWINTHLFVSFISNRPQMG
jgi:hypothetical protein